MVRLEAGGIYRFVYTNHRDETETRHVRYLHTELATVPPYYPEPTFLMHCHDLDKDSARSFDFRKIEAGTLERVSS